MSTAEAQSQNTNNTPSLTGGIPTKSADLGPSIVFLVLFVAALGGLFWRLIDKRSRWWVLIRPIVFVILQIAGGIIRAIISTGHYASGWFIGDQICALCGFIAVCEPVVVVLQRMIANNGAHFTEGHLRLASTAAAILRFGLLAAVGVGVGGATLISGNMSQSQLDTLYKLRQANAALVISIVAICTICFLLLGLTHIMTLRQLWPMLWACTFILIVSGYKLDTAIHPTNPFASGTKAGFYLLLVLPELLAVIPFIACNLKQTYPDETASERDVPAATPTVPRVAQPASAAPAKDADTESEKVAV